MKQFLLLLIFLSISIPTLSYGSGVLGLFGLFSFEGKPLPILSLKTLVYSEGSYAQIECYQIYRNPYDHPIETNFYFPRTASSVFHRFTAEFRDKRVVGKIMEKEAAKKSYEEHKANGDTVAYAEINKDVPDVMQVLVGNIPAYEEVTIIFSVIQPLRIALNKFWELTLLSTLTPLYGTSGTNAPDYNMTDPGNSLIGDWQIQIVLASSKPFEAVKNPSHKLLAQYSNSNGMYLARFDSSIPLNKDFVLYFRTQDMYEPHVALSQHPKYANDYMLYLSFFPKLNSITVETIFQWIDEGKDLLTINKGDYQEDLQRATAEFIFIIDRSGSMSGLRIQNLKKALIRFFNSLPQDCYFNIVSFGSTYNLYSQESVKCSPAAIDKVINTWIPTIQAGMGGTEILSAVQAVTGMPTITGYPRSVIFLTDGDVGNPDAIIKHVYDNSQRMRFCSVGIGNGISNYLITNIAKAGGCVSEFVKDTEDLGEKAIYILESAVSQHIEDIFMETNCYDSSGKLTVTSTYNQEFLLKNQVFEKYVYMPDTPGIDYCHVTVHYFSNYDQLTHKAEFTFRDFANSAKTDIWHKTGYSLKIQDLIFQSKSALSSESSSIKQQIIGLSIKYQVLCEYTAFLTVIETNTVDAGETQTVDIPVVSSYDYDSTGSNGNSPSNGNNGYVSYSTNFTPRLGLIGILVFFVLLLVFFL